MKTKKTKEIVHLAYYFTGFCDDPPVLLEVCSSRPIAENVIEDHKKTRDKSIEFNYKGKCKAKWYIEERDIK